MLSIVCQQRLYNKCTIGAIARRHRGPSRGALPAAGVHGLRWMRGGPTMLKKVRAVVIPVGRPGTCVVRLMAAPLARRSHDVRSRVSRIHAR